ncbi:MAG: glutamate 5-kinase [Candidatus Omnitrophica bacterium]|nr:glutamate 5-kinase [Candidatus Omnitrophota bacterium]
MTERWKTISRWVVKVGSSVLTNPSGKLLTERIEHLANQVSSAHDLRHQAVIVSSGAVACGMAKLRLSKRPTSLAQLQACAAIGQGELMSLYTSIFAARGLLTAQVLLTQDDLSNRTRFRNAKQTLLTLMHRRVIPIVNENDTVSVEEITFGDNDRLAALVAAAIDAELLIILSDVDGFLIDGKPLDRVQSLSSLKAALQDDSDRPTTKGGMASKLEAAKIVARSGIPLVIANGNRSGTLTDVLKGLPTGTLFVPDTKRLGQRKWWAAFALRQPKGRLIVDAGAARAITEQGKSLLASGIISVQGQFEAGTSVVVVGVSGVELGRGLCRFSSAEISRVLGMKTSEVAKVLGSSRAHEAIHRDNLVLACEL